MKIQNQQLERHFRLKNQHFYTDYFVNLQTKNTISLTNQREFLVLFEDGEQVSSQECNAHILNESNREFLVEFSHPLISLRIHYQAREDVLSKEITLLSSEKFINAIDIEYFDFETNKAIYYPKKQDDISELAGFSGYYVELGQPIYANSFFFGMEFPMGENRLEGQHYFSRYYVGQQINNPKIIWPSVVGAAASFEKEDIQNAFFTYIANIAQPSYFRKQYNSWYDHMTNINEQIILDSFKEIRQGFEDYGVHLDAYVVDDGWPDYKSIWEFNDKFPQGLDNIKKLVNQFGSNLGLWIGPRGGYNGTEVIMSDWLEAHPEFGSKNHLSNDVNVGDLRYLQLIKEKMLEHQRNYDISYWKIDGWLLKPDKTDCSGPFAMHTMTASYESLIDLLITLRKDRRDKDCWLNLTSYVNPSPWFLQWVNSLWIQISQDVSFVENGGSDLNRMMTYRDIQYYKFLKERDIQLPLWALYNHEPIYAQTAHSTYMDHQMSSSVKEFEDYLMFIATRGNGFWEFHYSYDMFDEERWQANARAVHWVEQNYSILKHSHMIGGNPAHFEVYGYWCHHSTISEEILSLRNPSDKPQRIELPQCNLKDYHVEWGGPAQIISTHEIELAPYTSIIFKKF